MNTADRELIEIEASDRNIKEILHFTRRENLHSIATHGLLSREQLKRRGLPFQPTDYQRMDQRLDHISLSISTLNRRMLRAKGMDKRARSYAVCVVDPCVLWELDCLFFPENAAHHRNREIDEENLSSYEAFTDMLDWRLSGLLGNLKPIGVPFDEQAEVMIRGSVPLRYIKKIEVACKTYIPKFAVRAPLPIESNTPRFLPGGGRRQLF